MVVPLRDRTAAAVERHGLAGEPDRSPVIRGTGADRAKLAVCQFKDHVDEVEPFGPMGQQQDSASGGGVEQVRDQRPCGGSVQTLGGLVEHENGLVGEQCAGQGDPPALSPGDQRAALAQVGVEACGQSVEPVSEPGTVDRRQQPRVIGAGVRQPEVLPQIRGEDVGVVGDEPDHLAYIVERERAHVGSADGHRAVVGIDEPQEHGRQRRLSGTGGSDDRDPPSWRKLEIHTVEHERVTVRPARPHS